MDGVARGENPASRVLVAVPSRYFRRETKVADASGSDSQDVIGLSAGMPTGRGGSAW